jgi:hypothetical protein
MRMRLCAFLLLGAVFAAPLWGQRAGPQNITAASGAGSCASVQISSGQASTVGIQIVGTWSATLQPQVKIAAQTAVNTTVTPAGSSSSQGTITANGIYTAVVAGMDFFQVCATAYTSGTATVYFNLSNGVAINQLGGGASGAVAITVNGGGVLTSPVNLQNGTNTTASNSGSNVQYNVPTATSSVLGVVEPDGTTIANTAGAIKVAIPNCISTVANLGLCPSLQAGIQAEVTDGASVTDCTVGGGSTLVSCAYNGASWAATFPGGLSVAGSQFAVQTNNGSGGLAGINSPTTNGYYGCGFNVTASVAVLFGCTLQGVAIDTSNPATLLYNDRAAYVDWTSGTGLALPAISGQFGSNFPFVLENNAGSTLTITPNAGASNLIDGSATGTLLPGFAAFVYSDGVTNWDSIKFPTFGAFPACTNILQFSTTTGFNCPAAPPVNLGVTNVKPAADSTSTFSVTGQTSGTNDFQVDTTNHRTCIGCAGAAPAAGLDVGGGKFEVNNTTGACPVINGFTTVAPGCTPLMSNTASGTLNNNLGATTLTASIAATHWYVAEFEVVQVAAGTSCATATSFVVNIIVQDPNAGGASTVPLIPIGTTSSTISISASTGNGAAGAQLAQLHYAWAQKASQTPQYSVTGYSAGTACSPAPTFAINPIVMMTK